MKSILFGSQDQRSMKKYVFILKNLTCAGCAAEIERELRTIDGIAGLTLDFLGRELILFVNKQSLEKEILQLVSKVVKKIEPEVEVVLSSHREKEYRFRDSIYASFKTREMLINTAGVIIFIAALFNIIPEVRIIAYLASYLIIGHKVIKGALRKLFSRYLFNEHLLMTVATLGAIFIGEYAEAIAVMLFYQIGRYFESKIVEYSQHSINEIQRLKPQYANLIQGDQAVKALPEQVKKGELILIKPGERVPLDGMIVEGVSEINNAFLTGETIPETVGKGDTVSAGAVNMHGTFTIRVEKEYEKSTISRIIELIRSAKSRKTKTERFISRFAAIYTPVILVLALLIATVPPFIIKTGTFETWFYRALIFLVISCPCALVVSVPLSFFAGLAVLIRNGVLMKGGIFLENLAKTRVVILDKTGTLTRGKIELAHLCPAKDISEETLLEYAYLAESRSNHPVAIAVASEYHSRLAGHKSMDNRTAASLSYQEIPGKGVIAADNELTVIAGSPSFLAGEGIKFPFEETKNGRKKMMIGVARNREFLGTIEFTDTIRERIPEMISRIKNFGVARILMLTGDREEIAAETSASLGIKEYHANLLPEEKLQFIERIKKESAGKVLYIGDGINDAPAMALADTGIAMGGIGSSAAIESSDIVLQTDEIDKLANIFKISHKTLNNAKQNIVLALGIKFCFLILGVFGLMTIWGAVFADVGVTVLAVMNSLRLLYYRKNF